MCYLVADAPTGDWSGYAQCVAAFTDAGWRFIPPREGITCYVRSTGSRAAYRDGGWEIGPVRGSALVLGGQQVVGLRAPAIAAASGGTIVDIEARVVIDQILAMLRQHGLIEP